MVQIEKDRRIWDARSCVQRESYLSLYQEKQALEWFTSYPVLPVLGWSHILCETFSVKALCLSAGKEQIGLSSCPRIVNSNGVNKH